MIGEKWTVVVWLAGEAPALAAHGSAYFDNCERSVERVYCSRLWLRNCLLA